MYWKTEPRPKQGAQRKVKKFAFLPKRCYKNHRHWLEEIYVVSEYSFGWWDKLYIDCDIPLTKETTD